MRMLKIAASVYLSAMSLTAQADPPPIFSITPIGTLPTIISSGGTVTATYLITNNMSYTLEKNGLNYSGEDPTPQGVSQNTSNPANCADPFTLAPHQSCTLVLTIVADQLVGGKAVGGPKVCNSKEHPVRCSVPDDNNQLNVTVGSGVSCGGAHCIAVGFDANSFKPLLVQSVNDAPWAVVPFIESTGTPSQFNSTNCNGDLLCMAVGVNESFPLLAQSQNGGITWTVVSTFNPGITTNGSFIGSACTGNFCIAVGHDSGGPQPLLAQSKDGGTTWGGVGLGISSGTLFSASCTDGTICIGVGLRNPLSHPSIVRSSDGGNTWAAVPITGFSDTGSLNSVSCSGSFCIAGGNDFTTNTQLLVQSTDSGASWNRVSLPSLTNDINFTAVSCSGNLCIAAGRDFSTGSPVLVQTTDGGTSWAVVTIFTPPIPSQGIFSGASCSGSLCIAVGKNNVTGAPLLVQTVDGGSNWTVVTTFTPAITNKGQFNSATCMGAICIAAGADNNGTHPPLLVQTSDGGVQWGGVAVPDITNKGSFNGTAMSGSLLLEDDYFFTRSSQDLVL